MPPRGYLGNSVVFRGLSWASACALAQHKADTGTQSCCLHMPGSSPHLPLSNLLEPLELTLAKAQRSLQVTAQQTDIPGVSL